MSQHETATYHDNIIFGGIAVSLGMRTCCPEFGTLSCIDCPLGLQRPLEICDAHCSACYHVEQCPCTLRAWEARIDNDTRDVVYCP